MKKLSDGYLREVIKLAQPGYREKLTLDDAREMVENFTELMNVMEELEEEITSRDTEFVYPPLEWWEDPKNVDRPMVKRAMFTPRR